MTSANASPSNTPAAEVDITPALVRRLLEEQHPDLAGLPLVELGVGWDNVMYRLGDELTVRLPRRSAAADLIGQEQRWLPELAPRLPLPVPAPVRVGRPGLGFPWSWSVLPWFGGVAAGVEPPHDRQAAARAVGRFLAALHTPAPTDAPENRSRGGPLSGRDAMTRERIDLISGDPPAETPPAEIPPAETPPTETPPADRGSSHRPLPDRAALATRWQRCLAQPRYDGPPMWLHGDLHPYNLLVDDGVIGAVIDFGDITGGDPATDLAVAYAMFDEPDRSALRAAADTPQRPIDDAMWIRAEGWCLSVGLTILANSADNPAMYELGRRMVAC